MMRIRNARGWRPSLQLSDLNVLIKQMRKTLSAEIGSHGISEVAEHALARGSEIIVQSAKANLRRLQSPKASGGLVSSIGYTIRKFPFRGFTMSVIGPQWPQGAHGHLFELGTHLRPNYRIADKRERKEFKKLRRLKDRITYLDSGWGTVLTTGIMPAQPFLRPAFDENAQKVKTEIALRLKTFYESMMSRAVPIRMQTW